jgi:hypothetical protein
VGDEHVFCFEAIGRKDSRLSRDRVKVKAALAWMDPPAASTVFILTSNDLFLVTRE